jgi:hypothetical protein
MVLTASREGRVQERELRNSTDPIYPPVLMESQPRGAAVLLRETINNRRDGQMGMDGGGVGMLISDADDHGFRGTFEPWGMVTGYQGYYCATRVR